MKPFSRRFENDEHTIPGLVGTVGVHADKRGVFRIACFYPVGKTVEPGTAFTVGEYTLVLDKFEASPIVNKVTILVSKPYVEKVSEDE